MKCVSKKILAAEARSTVSILQIIDWSDASTGISKARLGHSGIDVREASDVSRRSCIFTISERAPFCCRNGCVNPENLLSLAEEVGDVGSDERLSNMLEPRWEVGSALLVDVSMGPNGGLGVKES